MKYIEAEINDLDKLYTIVQKTIRTIILRESLCYRNIH